MLLGNSFFPSLISGPFMDGVRVAFTACAVLALIAAIFSGLRGRQVVTDESLPGESMVAAAGAAAEAALAIPDVPVDDEMPVNDRVPVTRARR